MASVNESVPRIASTVVLFLQSKLKKHGRGLFTCDGVCYRERATNGEHNGFLLTVQADEVRQAAWRAFPLEAHEHDVFVPQPRDLQSRNPAKYY